MAKQQYAHRAGISSGNIYTYDKEVPGRHSHPSHCFYFPEEDHLRFIEEIGSEREERISKFKLIKQVDERREKRGE